ncbi:MAG: hypothetical protein WC523_05015 [Patescibacteria group bacterium]
MQQIEDKLCICLYCGATMKGLTKEQMKRFGRPTCCEYAMVEMDKAKIYIIVKSLDALKKNLEQEILQGMQ